MASRILPPRDSLPLSCYLHPQLGCDVEIQVKEVVGIEPTLNLHEELQGRRRLRAADTVLVLLADELDVGRRGRQTFGTFLSAGFRTSPPCSSEAR